MCLWCYSEYISTPGKLPNHGGNRARDLWFASPMLCQLSYEASWFEQQSKIHKQSKQTCHILHHDTISHTKSILIIPFKKNGKKCFSLYCVKQFLSFLTCFFKSLPLSLLTVRHIFEISEVVHP